MIGHRPSKLAALPTALLCFAPLSGASALQAQDPPSDLCALFIVACRAIGQGAARNLRSAGKEYGATGIPRRCFRQRMRL